MTKVFFTICQDMKSGFSEQTDKVYRRIDGKSGDVWLVACVPNEGDYIYVSGGPNSRGFGGATLSFNLEDGSQVKLQGPWHSNSNSLYQNTGYDARHKHLTYGIVAEGMENAAGRWGAGYFDRLIHLDEGPVVGEYDRIKNIAQEWTDRHKTLCYYAYVSNGGGSMSSTRVYECPHVPRRQKTV